MSKDATKRASSALGLALRIYRGERSRSSLAKASKIQRWRLAAYERGEMVPEPDTLSRMAEAMNVSAQTIRSLAELLDCLPEVLEPGASAESIKILEVASRLARSVGSAPVRLALAEQSRVPHPQWQTEDLWARLKAYSSGQRQALIFEVPDFHEWTLCVLLCDESIEAAAEDPVEALELARLAELISRFSPGCEARKLRLRGYCLYHVSSALRVSGKLREASQELDRAEVCWHAGSEDSLDQKLNYARVLGLKASLLRAQGNLSGAILLLDEALENDSNGETKLLLLNRAATLEKMGENLAAIETLYKAATYINPEREPRLLWSQRFNLAVNLGHLGRYEEAQQWMGDIRRLAPKGVSRTRIAWLEGTLAAGLGQTEDAEAFFKSVREEFVARKNALDAALVSLDLAVLYLPQGRMAEVKALAVEMVTIFRDQKVHREALAAVRLFREAAERERATVELARRLAEYLRRARFEEGVRFVGQG